MTAAIEGLTDEENSAARVGGLMAKQIDRKAECVEDCSTVVAEADVVDRVRGGAVVHVVLSGTARGEA